MLDFASGVEVGFAVVFVVDVENGFVFVSDLTFDIAFVANLDIVYDSCQIVCTTTIEFKCFLNKRVSFFY